MSRSNITQAPGHWRADSALFCVALVWGTTFVLVKQALPNISTFYFLALRFSVATICMSPLLLPAFRRQSFREGLAANGRGLGAGAVAGGFLWLGYLLQTFGLKYTTAGNSGFLTGLYVPLVPLIGAAVSRKRPHRAEIVGVLVAVAGMAVLIGPSLDSQFHFNFGDLLTLGCAVAFAIHLLVLGHFTLRHSFGAVAVGQIACTALLSFVSLLAEPPVARWTTSLVFAILVTGVLATALAFALQTWAQQFTSPTRTAIIFSLEPVFALATAVVFGGEALTVGAVCGGALILCGILIVELRPFGQREISSKPAGSAP